MGRFIAVGSDFHGDYNKIDNFTSKIPYGTNIYFAGDMNGPKGKWFTENIKNSLRTFSDYGFFSGLVNQAKKNTKEHQQFVKESHEHTAKSIEVIAKHSARAPVAIAIPGNNEIYHHELWKSYNTSLKSSDAQFEQSHIPYGRMPLVHFYKNGQRVEDATNVDTAVVVLPNVLTKKIEYSLSKAKGKSSNGANQINEAIYEITKSGGVLDQIKKANPKHIYQIQHEEPNSNFLVKFFKNPTETEHKSLYQTVINGIKSFQKYNPKNRIQTYEIVFGHIAKGGRFRQKINADKETVNVIHIDEGNELMLIDTITGKVYSQGEMPLSQESEVEMIELTQVPYSSGKHLETTLEEIIETSENNSTNQEDNSNSDNSSSE